MAVTMHVYARDGLKRDGPINDARFFWVQSMPDRVTRLDADGLSNAYFVYVPQQSGVVRAMASDDRYSDTWVENNRYYEVWI